MDISRPIFSYGKCTPLACFLVLCNFPKNDQMRNNALKKSCWTTSHLLLSEYFQWHGKDQYPVVVVFTFLCQARMANLNQWSFRASVWQDVKSSYESEIELSMKACQEGGTVLIITDTKEACIWQLGQYCHIWFVQTRNNQKTWKESTMYRQIILGFMLNIL